MTSTFSSKVLELDVEKAVAEIESAIRKQVFEVLKRKGAVLGLSGGIDSSVSCALCVRALGKERVLGLFMPESDSASESLRLGKEVADWLGVSSLLEDITPILKAAGCYEKRDQSVRKVIPEFGEGYKCKIVLPSILEESAYSIFSVVAQTPQGKIIKARLTG